MQILKSLFRFDTIFQFVIIWADEWFAKNLDKQIPDNVEKFLFSNSFCQVFERVYSFYQRKRKEYADKIKENN